MSVEKSQKKELLQAYKGRRRVGCVYGLRHRPTGRMLVQHDADVQSARNRFRFCIDQHLPPPLPAGPVAGRRPKPLNWWS